MARKLEFWGIFGTVVYLLLIATTVVFKFQSFVNLSLNELGDFLAGAFGPVAFLWLVLGFFQQGRELKLSSEALQLQAEELKNSVEQQAHLVAVGREQMNAQIEASAHDRRRYERSMEAHIVFESKECISSREWAKHSYTMGNIGADAIDLQIMVKLPGNNVHAVSTVLKRDQLERIVFEYSSVDEDYSTILHCFYKTHDRRQIGFKMDVSVSAKTNKLSISPQINAKDL